MKNFAKKSFIEKKTWGVLGKIQELYSPEQFQDETRIVPLNANPLEAWDSTRSRYIRRVQGPLPNDGQQAGVVPQVSDVTPTPTPSNTPTPSITPSSTPLPLPETPALWYDSTNLGSIDYITSGGTNYVQNWRSIGTYQKTLSASTINNAPIWSGSSRFPDSPLVVRFTKTSNTALINWLSQRFDSTPIPQSGITVFHVVANPVGGNYVLGSTSYFLYSTQFISGNTTGGFTAPVQLGYTLTPGQDSNGIRLISQLNGVTTLNNIAGIWSGNAINDMMIYHQTVAQASGSLPFTLNNTGSTFTTPITGTNLGNITTVSFGSPIQAAGTPTNTIIPSVEMAEVMMFNRVLTSGETQQVIDYLRDKWKYNEWSGSLPTPTPSSTNTPTPSVTTTNTPTTTTTMTPTPSSTPPPFVPSGITNLQNWYVSTSGATVSSWTNLGLLGGSMTQGTGANQPQIITSTLGSFTGTSVQFTSRDFMSSTFSSTNYTASTVYSVMKVNDTDANGWTINLFTTGTNNVSWDWQSYASPTTSITRKRPGTATSPTRVIAPLLLATSGQTGSFFTGSFNDTIGASGSTTYTGVTATNLNFGYDPGASNTNIEIFEFLVYNKVLTNTEHANVINYLKNKYQYNTW